jgi:dUTP pyrophosphatase
MIIPKQFLKSGNFFESADESQFQPCGVDVTLKAVLSFSSPGKLDFDNKDRKISDVSSLDFQNDEILLLPGSYKVQFNEYVKIPSDAAALCLPRSSLLRCGATLECAVWDPGYEGRSEALLVVHNPYGLTLKRNAKIGQMIFIKLSDETESLYSGVYKGENK